MSIVYTEVSCLREQFIEVSDHHFVPHSTLARIYRHHAVQMSDAWNYWTRSVIQLDVWSPHIVYGIPCLQWVHRHVSLYVLFWSSCCLSHCISGTVLVLSKTFFPVFGQVHWVALRHVCRRTQRVCCLWPTMALVLPWSRPQPQQDCLLCCKLGEVRNARMKCMKCTARMKCVPHQTTS